MTIERRFGSIGGAIAFRILGLLVYVGFGRWLSPQESFRRLFLSGLLFLGIFTVMQLIWPRAPDDRGRRFWRF